MEIEISLNGNHKFKWKGGNHDLKVKVPYTPKDSACGTGYIIPEPWNSIDCLQYIYRGLILGSPPYLSAPLRKGNSVHFPTGFGAGQVERVGHSCLIFSPVSGPSWEVNNQTSSQSSDSPFDWWWEQTLCRYDRWRNSVCGGGEGATGIAGGCRNRAVFSSWVILYTSFSPRIPMWQLQRLVILMTVTNVSDPGRSY